MKTSLSQSGSGQTAASTVLVVLIISVLMVSACSGDRSANQIIPTYVSGTITVELPDEDEADFSGIRLLALASVNDRPADTLFHAYTDVDGRFNTVAYISERGIYPVVISRNDRIVHVANLVLAQGDTIRITGSLPSLDRNFRVFSMENDAMSTYERIQRLYGRVATLAYGGRVSADSIPILMNQWSDIFWSIQEEYPGTFASELASIDAIEILDGWNEPQMIERIESLKTREIYFPVKVIYGAQIISRQNGLDAGLRYLDELRRRYSTEEQRITIDMRKVELMVESVEYDRALSELETLRRRYRSDERFQMWVETVGYEIRNLMPGSPMPGFNFVFDDSGFTLSRDSLLGYYYLLEIVLLADSHYQMMYPELLALYRSIPDSKIRFFSIPLDNSQITVDGFFEERRKLWDFADAGVFEQSGLLGILQIEQVPTRFLVGPDGKIIRRYLTREIDRLREDINLIIQNQLNS